MAGHPPGDNPAKTDTGRGDWLLKLIATVAAGLPAYYFADGAVRGLALHALLSLGFCVYTHFMDAATGVEQAVLAVIVVSMALLTGRAVQKVDEQRRKLESGRGSALTGKGAFPGGAPGWYARDVARPTAEGC
jgi:hypothetical protein